MGTMHATHPLRIFGLSGILTVLLGVVVVVFGGLEALWVYLVLVVLEITFSFDNAIVNSRVLLRLNKYWQTLFLTVGIFLAVFVVRFLLPVTIVVIATKLNFFEVIGLAVHAPVLYAAELHHAEPLIGAFGGMFLVLLGLDYFIDREKHIYWLSSIEKALARLAAVRYVTVAIIIVVAAIIGLTVAPAVRGTVLWSSLAGIVLFVALELASSLFGDTGKTTKKPVQLAGMAAFAVFSYLQVLDASFSFDGVIGAFAITTSVLLIMAGLGAGAVWVRSLTVYLVRSGTLAKYRYLEHGAYWAILVLGIVMLAKLYHLELPEWATGLVGLVLIGAALATSIIETDDKKKRRTARK